jgi:hypothetical protein
MTDYHESWDALDEDARNVHRALSSLKEEIEAVDWYHQRVVLCQDEELRKVLAHNRDEEIEHACMTLEWLRRKMPAWEEQLKTYLFTEVSIVEAEEAAEGGGESGGGEGESGSGASGGLGIGSLKEE